MASVGGGGRENPNPAFLKALEAVVAAGKRGLLGPAALAAAEKVPELSPHHSRGDTEEGDPRWEPQEGPESFQGEKRKRKKTKIKYVIGIQKRIWICGNSVVLASEKRAKNNSLGKQLGIPLSKAFVYWHGRLAMKWEDLLLVVNFLYHKHCPPSILIIRLGEDDLLSNDNLSLLIAMKNDLEILRKALPDTVIILSSLLPICISKTFENPEHVEQAVKEINTRMADYCNKINVHFMSHSSITSDKTHLFSPNFSALSDAGANLFIADVQAVLHHYLNSFEQVVEKTG